HEASTSRRRRRNRIGHRIADEGAERGDYEADPESCLEAVDEHPLLRLDQADLTVPGYLAIHRLQQVAGGERSARGLHRLPDRDAPPVLVEFQETPAVWRLQIGR